MEGKRQVLLVRKDRRELFLVSKDTGELIYSQLSAL